MSNLRPQDIRIDTLCIGVATAHTDRSNLLLVEPVKPGN
jgi:hypothetical protein